ncbi:hypothetical protein ACFLS1_07350 [Verrucomicrobiota bacterium]
MSKAKLILACVLLTSGFAAAAMWHPVVRVKIRDLFLSRKEIHTRKNHARKTSAEHTATPQEFASLLKKAFALKDKQEIHRLADILADKNVEKALDLIMLMDPDWQAKRTYISACAEKNPHAAAVWAVTKSPKSGNSIFTLRRSLYIWVSRDPHLALEWARTLSSEQNREYSLWTIFEAWAQTDPKASAEQLELTTDFVTKNIAYGRIAYAWALQDLHSAVEWAWNMPDGNSRNSALRSIAEVVCNLDDPAAVELAKKLPSKKDHDNTIRAMASLISDDIDTASDWIASRIPGGFGKDTAFRIAITDWTLKNPDEAIEWASQLSNPSDKEYMFSIMAQALAASDIETATALALNLSPGGRRRDAIRRIASTWARKDTDAAEDWAEQLQDDDLRAIAQDVIENSDTDISSVGQPVQEEPTSPPEEYISPPPAEEDDPPDIPDDPPDEEDDPPDIPDDPPDEEDDPPDIPDDPPDEEEDNPPDIENPHIDDPPPPPPPTVEGLPDDLRTRLIHDWAFKAVEAGCNPLTTITILEELLPAGRELDNPIKIIVSECTAADQQFWSDWACERPEGHDRDIAVSGAIYGFINTASIAEYPDEAAQLINNLSAGATRENMITCLSYASVKQDNDVALEWISNLADEQDKNFALSEVKRLESFVNEL